jgi:hypothetical protein
MEKSDSAQRYLIAQIAHILQYWLMPQILRGVLSQSFEIAGKTAA